MKPCLWCGRSLDEPDLDHRHLTVICACGLVYAVDVIEQTPLDEWLAMFREDGYMLHRDGDTLTVTDLLAAP